MTLLKEVLNRLKSPVVIGGIIAIMIQISGVNPSTMTSWPLLGETILANLANPFVVVTILAEVYAFLNNPKTKEKF